MSAEDSIIEPNQLEAGAVVPQCLDNMYVSDRTFEKITKDRTSLQDPVIQTLKEHETRTEYVRSLVYATQVIVNRAYFINNAVVNSALKATPENAENRRAFIHFLRSKVIVPYLWKERRFDEWPEFGITEEGRRLIEDLLKELGELPALRLSRNDERNNLLTSNMAKKFDEYFTSLRKLDELQVNVVASELFNAVPGREEAMSQTDFQRFRGKLDEVSRFAFDQPQGKPITRDMLYGKFVCEPGTKVPDGQFRSPQPGDFTVELKKLFDLRYNTNLSDFLGRYTFAPVGLPGRSALCDETSGDGGIAHEGLDGLLDNVRRLFMERAQKSMTLPLLASLSLADVHEIRTLPTWAEFTTAQERILKAPTQALELLAPFGEAFEAFQTELSRWYYKKYKEKASEGRYVTAVGVVLSVAGKVLSAKYGAGPIQKAAIGSVGDLVPDRVKGVVAKLLVAVYDADRNVIDRERSYSVDIWKKQEELTREQLGALTAQFGPLRGGGGMANSSMAAAQ
jgi:hypothetical protein